MKSVLRRILMPAGILGALTFCHKQTSLPEHSQAPNRTTSQKSSITPQNYPKYKRFGRAAEAVKELINIFNPDVIGFGEIHNEYCEKSFISTSELFSHIIKIIQESYPVLVLEFTPDFPEVPNELAHLRASGRLNNNTPTLLRWAEGCDKKGVHQVYESASGMEIKPGNINPEEDKNKLAGKIFPLSTHIIARRMEQNALAALSQGEKVILFGGMNHNDAVPKASAVNKSYAPVLMKKYGYLEIDLIVPDIFNFEQADFEEKRLYQHLVPKSGVLLIRRSERSFVILFPYSSKPEAK